jgi:hypothetical protein
MNGHEVYGWMQSELQRVNSLIREIHAQPTETGEILMTDGGTMRNGLVSALDTKNIVRIFNEFLPPLSARKSTL